MRIEPYIIADVMHMQVYKLLLFVHSLLSLLTHALTHAH